MDIVDIPVTSDAVSGDVLGVGITIGNTRVLEVSGIADGSGGVSVTNVKANGSVTVGDDTTGATVDNRGALRYREDGLGSYTDMVMATSSGVYGWVNIVSNIF
jgi:hypothetical protein